MNIIYTDTSHQCLALLSGTRIFATIIVMLGISSYIHAQSTLSYTTFPHYNYRCYALLDLDTAILAGTDCGLACINTTTNNVYYYDILNLGLWEGYVRALAKDSNDRIWIGTFCGFYCWQGNNVIRYTPQNSILTSRVTALHYSKVTNALYAGLRDGKILKIDSSGWNYIYGSVILNPGGEVNKIIVDANGHIWASVNTLLGLPGLYKFDGTDWHVFNNSNSPLNGAIHSFAIDDAGIIWVTDGTLYSFDGSSWTLRTYFGGPWHDYISAEENNTIWISTLNGLIVYDGTSAYYHPQNPLLTHPHIHVHLVRKNGEFFTGMHFDGVDRISGLNVTNYPLTPTLISNSVTDIAYDTQNHKTWFATRDNKVHTASAGSYNDTVWENVTALNSPISGAFATSIAVDSNSIVYLGTENQGLWVRQAGNWQNFNALNSTLFSDTITALAVDYNNRLLIGFKEGKVQTKAAGNFVTVIQDPNLNSKIRRILPENNTTFWVATESSGLIRCNYTSHTVFNTANSGLPSNRISDICIDHLNNYWVGTDSTGLAKYDGTNWTVLTTANSGLPEDLIEYLTMAPDSSLWIATTHQAIAVIKNNTWAYYNDCSSPLYLHSGGVMRCMPDGCIYTIGNGVMKVSFNTVTQNASAPNSGRQNSVFPNPGSGIIRFVFQLPERSACRLNIYNSYGQEVYGKRLTTTESGELVAAWDTDIGPVPAGIYFYSLTGENIRQSGKVVVQR